MARSTSSQLDLFAQVAGPAAPRKTGLEPVPPRPEHVALRAQLGPNVHLGASTWSFPGWNGHVYDGVASEAQLARHGLRAYAQHPLFNAVGVDRTFYLPIGADLFRAFAAQVPDDFRFLTKAHDHLTLAHFPPHPRYGAMRGQPNPRFLDASYARDVVVAPVVEGLGPKSGPLAFQISPQDLEGAGGAAAFIERLHGFLGALPRGPQYAVEVRNTELLTHPSYAPMLASVGAAHVYIAWSRMPPVTVQARWVKPETQPVVIARWMLPRGGDYEALKRKFAPFDRIVDPDPEGQASLAALLRGARARGQDAYAICSNKAEGCAPESASNLARAVVA
jgi:uncharacterized protein YecE (DUF72 family)